MKLNRIDSELSVDFNEGRRTIGLYDCRAYTPSIETVLTYTQMDELVALWFDGRCICGKEIPQGHRLCRQCASEESYKWFGPQE